MDKDRAKGRSALYWETESGKHPKWKDEGESHYSKHWRLWTDVSKMAEKFVCINAIEGTLSAKKVF